MSIVPPEKNWANNHISIVRDLRNKLNDAKLWIAGAPISQAGDNAIVQSIEVDLSKADAYLKNLEEPKPLVEDLVKFSAPQSSDNTNWVQFAYSRLGAVRDGMSATDIEVIQRFLDHDVTSPLATPTK